MATRVKKRPTVAIMAGTLARAERLRKELGIDAYAWSTNGGSPGRGFVGIRTILVDGTSRWGEEVQAAIRPLGAQVYWLERVLEV